MTRSILFFILILPFTSCGLRDDGSMSFEGNVYNMLYFESNEDLLKAKDKLIQQFGQPDSIWREGKAMKWNGIELGNQKDINLVADIMNSYRMKGSVRTFENSTISFISFDKEGNDLLVKGSDSKTQIKNYLEEHFKEYLN